MEPFLSVIIPVFNVEEYISQCLDSVLTQTEGDIEIIVVNDGTTDKSGKIADNYAEIDSRIKVVHKENGGLSSARNAGIKIAHGRYVLFLDSDDWLEANAVEILKAIILESDYDTVMFTWDIIDQSNHWVSKKESVFEDGFTFDEYNKARLYKTFFRGTQLNSVCQRIYKRELLIKYALLFDESQKYCEDLIFSLDYIICCTNGLYIDKTLYKYRLNPQSLSRTYNLAKFDYIKRANLVLLSRLVDLEMDDDNHKYILAMRFLKACLDLIIGLFTSSNRQDNLAKKYVIKIAADDYFQRCVEKVRLKEFGVIRGIQLLLIRKKMIRLVCLYNNILFSKLGFTFKKTYKGLKVKLG